MSIRLKQIGWVLLFVGVALAFTWFPIPIGQPHLSDEYTAVPGWPDGLKLAFRVAMALFAGVAGWFTRPR